MSLELHDQRMLRRAYRIAKREGYILRKSRRALSPHNGGGLMLVDPTINVAVLGWDYDATPEEVLFYFDVKPTVNGLGEDAESAKGDRK